MTRLLILHHAGSEARNLVIAYRLSRKIRGAQKHGHCVLIDCEDVDVAPEFLAILLADARPDKVRFFGLPLHLQVNLSWESISPRTE